MKKFTLIISIMLTGNLLSAQWIQQNLNYPTEGALSDIFFIDHNLGWTVGESDQYGCQGHYTIDGGNEWNSMVLDLTEKANSVFFSDQNNGWIVFDNGEILRTNDGGGNLLSWESQESGTEYDLLDVYFIDSLVGWIAADSNTYPQVGILYKILKTVNGGSTWEEQTSNTGYLNKIFFLNALTGWTIGSVVRHSTDGGDTWSEQFTGLENGVFEAICFVDANNGWLLGVVSGDPNSYVYYTNDMGNTWEEILNVPYYLTDIKFTDPLNGWLIGDNGTILHTSDGGETWESQESGTTNWLKSVCFTDQNFGWICDGTEGSDPVILHTTNGGIVGIKENRNSNTNLIIYPNPTNEIATVSFYLAQNEKITFSITNTKGQVLKQISFEEKAKGQFDIDCSNYSPGIYFIALKTDSGILTEKLIIE